MYTHTPNYVKYWLWVSWVVCCILQKSCSNNMTQNRFHGNCSLPGMFTKENSSSSELSSSVTCLFRLLGLAAFLIITGSFIPKLSSKRPTRNFPPHQNTTYTQNNLIGLFLNLERWLLYTKTTSHGNSHIQNTINIKQVRQFSQYIHITN